MEIWKKIKNWPGYRVSNMGRVKSLTRKVRRKDGAMITKHGKYLNCGLDESGYPFVVLCRNGFNRIYRNHQLVAISFLKNKNKNKNEVNHLNCIKTDNRVENLEYVTHKENMQHALLNGRFHTPLRLAANRNRSGSLCSTSKLDEKKVLYILNSKERTLDLSKKFNVSKSVISTVRHGKAWKHVKQTTVKKEGK